MKIKKTTIWQIVSAILAVLLIASIYTEGFKKSGQIKAPLVQGFSAVVLSDERCETCDTTQLIEQLNQVFPGLEVIEYDYNDKEGKAIYEENELAALPAVLFTKEIETQENYAQVQGYLESKGDYLSLSIGASFDPNAEICDNEKDDNGDKKVDCDDESCKDKWMCMEKMDKPEVELFVMSHCPYGTQVEKGALPVVDLLGDKIDFEIKFVNYAMHGEKETTEQTNQYCIQKEQNDKYIDYLKCFLEAGDSAACFTKTKIDTDKMEECAEATDEEFQITYNLENKEGQFPKFLIHEAENLEYGVRGSPHVVINGVTASVGRDAASLLKAVCTGFKDEPAECSETLSSTPPGPGFGFDSAGAATTASCG